MIYILIIPLPYIMGYDIRPLLTLNEKEKFEIWHTVEAINKKGVVCARATMQVYLRDDKRNEKLGF